MSKRNNMCINNKVNMSPLKWEYYNILSNSIWESVKEPIYFISIRETNKDIKKIKGLILGVIESGEFNNKYYHVISTTNDYGLTIISSKRIWYLDELCNILKEMQKDKSFIGWDVISHKWLNTENLIKKKSLFNYEHLLEKKQKERYSLSELFEEINSITDDFKIINNYSLIESTRQVILRYIQKLSIQLELPFYKLLNNDILKKVSRNSSYELIEIRSFLKTSTVQLHLRLFLWYLLYLVIFLGGLANINMQELYRKVGMYMLETFEHLSSNLSGRITDKLCYRLGDYLCNALETLLKEGMVLLWSKQKDPTISILETVNKYVNEEVHLKKNFLEYLKIENIFESSIAMIAPPVSKKGYYNLSNIKTITTQGLNISIQITELGYRVIDLLQKQRYRVNQKTYIYLKNNLNYFLGLEELKKKPLLKEEVSKPDFVVFNKKQIKELRSALPYNNDLINSDLLISYIIEKVIKKISKMNIKFNSDQLFSRIELYLKKLLIDKNYIKTSIDVTKLCYVCKSLILEYKDLLYKYAMYMVYKKKLKGINAKLDTLKKTILTLEVWRRDYVYFDGDESIYFVWRIDHRGRLYQIGGMNMMSNKIIRYCLDPDYKYKLKDFLTDIKIDISSHYFGSNSSFSDQVIRFDSNINEWLSNKKTYIRKADNKYGFLRGLLEYEAYLLDNDYETSYLISLDGTANVYQHISCITKDKELAKAVNLINTDYPNDLYDTFLKLLKSNNKHVTRKALKKSIMCYAYGLTDYGRLNSLKESLPSNLSKEEILDISNLLSQKLITLYPGIVKVRHFLEHLVKEKAKQELPLNIKNDFIEWKHLKYKVKKTQFSYMKPFSLSRSKTRIYLLEYTNKLDINKMKTSITANYIHHLDSESLMRTVLEYSHITKNKPIFTIHDCFMVPAPYKGILKNCFKNSLITIYKDKNVLKELSLSNNISFKDELLDINNGNFDISEILNSNYLLS